MIDIFCFLVNGWVLPTKTHYLLTLAFSPLEYENLDETRTVLAEDLIEELHMKDVLSYMNATEYGHSFVIYFSTDDNVYEWCAKNDFEVIQ